MSEKKLNSISFTEETHSIAFSINQQNIEDIFNENINEIMEYASKNHPLLFDAKSQPYPISNEEFDKIENNLDLILDMMNTVNHNLIEDNYRIAEYFISKYTKPV